MVTAEVAGSAAYSQVNMTSSAVKGTPSCQTTPCLETPGDRGAIRRQVAVRKAGNRFGQDRHEFPMTIEASQWLVHDTCGIAIFETIRQVRIQQRRRLPPQES